MRDPFSADKDRRRNPRFLCGGQARIVSLPSEGVLVSGKLRDLSLAGCRIETGAPLECGSLAEILVHVNATSFRALGQVKAIRGPSGIGVEFLQLSTSGHDMLEELLQELARHQAIASALRAARREPDWERLDQRRAALLNGSVPIIGIVESKPDEAASPVVDRPSLIIEAELDLFV